MKSKKENILKSNNHKNPVQTYDKYKDSGIEWLGKIPEHWEIKRIKDVTKKIGSGVTPKGGSEVYVDSGIPFLRSQNIYNDGLKIEDVSFITQTIHNKMKNSQIKPNDILINITGASIGRTCLIPKEIKEANINQHIIYIRCKERIVPFISNFLKTHTIKEYINRIQAGTSKEALNMGQILTFPSILPPLPEQTTIATYLDKKTKAIDKKINLLTQKTEKYKELRKAIINETVTKGLDKNTVWKTYRLKDIGYIYSGLSGKSGDDFKKDNNPNNRGFIPFTNIANNTYLDINHLNKVVIYPKERQNKAKKNDLFFLMSSEGYEDIGKSAVLKEDIPETYLNSFCKGFRITKPTVDSFFINYLLLSDNNRKKMVVQGKGFTRINLKIEKVNNFEITIPSTKQEQTDIAKYLDEKTDKIDKILSNIQKQINILKELRKTLVNDVVTGKIKVI